MNRSKNSFLLRTGIHVAEILSSSENTTLIFERAGKYLFQQLAEYIDQVRIYLIDEVGENLQEEVVCSDSGVRQGYDLVPLYQLPETITRERRVARIQDQNASYLLVPLEHDHQLIGLLELRTSQSLARSFINGLEEMRNAISLGINHILLVRSALRDKLFFDTTVEITHRLQSISRIDELLSVFAKLTVNYLKFDRVTLFIFDNEGKHVAYNRCVSIMGEDKVLKEIPQLPDLKNGPEPLQHLAGYWIPLCTNIRSVGVALFDNIYSLYKIPDKLVEILLPLCSQLAAAIENLRLFSDVQKAAQRDKLTDLYNRAFFEEELRRLDTGSQLPISIIIGDVNGLKVTNDVFGHLEGDHILKAIAAVMKKSCRKEDIIARWGGDEFIVLLPGTSAKQAEEICQRIRNACLNSEYSKIQLNISLGHATKEASFEDMTEVLKNAEDRMYRHKLLESRSFRSSFISSMKETLLEKCQETAGHLERMEKLSIKIGTAMELNDNELDELKLLAMLHDIGKVAISDAVLNKPGKLDDKEWEEMKKHSEIGYRIAQTSPELSQIANYILCHHERWDGNGYPLGKKNLQIPKLSRIIAIIDAYDVMTHSRSYKDAISHKDAVDELVRCAGKQFDPDIVELFVRMQNIFCEE